VGIALTYYVFIASTLREVGLTVQPWVVMMLMALLEIPLALLSHLEKLAPILILATVFCGMAWVGILIQLLVKLAEDGVDPSCVGFNPHSYTLVVGASVFSYEGSAALALPVHKAARIDLQTRAPALYVGTVAVIVVLYTAFAGAGYFVYGEHVPVIIIQALPSGWFAVTARLLYTFMVYFTFPFQLFPASTILMARFMRDQQTAKVMVMRGLLVILLGAAAIVLAGALDHLTALIGSILGIPLCFVFPALIHMNLMPQTLLTLVRNGFLIVMGVITMIFTTVVTIRTWGQSQS